MSYFQLSTLHATLLHVIVYTLTPAFNISTFYYSISILLVNKFVCLDKFLQKIPVITKTVISTNTHKTTLII